MPLADFFSPRTRRQDLVQASCGVKLLSLGVRQVPGVQQRGSLYITAGKHSGL